jgi:hypothetical protein
MLLPVRSQTRLMHPVAPRAPFRCSRLQPPHTVGGGSCRRNRDEWSSSTSFRNEGVVKAVMSLQNSNVVLRRYPEAFSLMNVQQNSELGITSWDLASPSRCRLEIDSATMISLRRKGLLPTFGTPLLSSEASHRSPDQRHELVEAQDNHGYDRPGWRQPRVVPLVRFLCCNGRADCVLRLSLELPPQ